MKELSGEELHALSAAERWEYYEKIRSHKWSQMSSSEKRQAVLSDLVFLIERGEPSSFVSREMIFDAALAPRINRQTAFDHFGSDFINLIDKLKDRINEKEKFNFFWATQSPFSQWHKSDFQTDQLFSFEHFGLLDRHTEVINARFVNRAHTYSSAEQFMMFQKAMIFLDEQAAQEILNFSDVRKIKEIGRGVKNYDENVWKFFRCEIVYGANKAKFTQDQELKELLFSTKGTTLVEASPNDLIWGIGLAQEDPLSLSRTTWKGKNLLGEMLTQLRMDLMGEY